ncbi:DUF883 C-terminal domain-containing protein [Methylomarinum sp. Ch1-1]|uniref:DUF883 C-terminal domain-containing protein n=1 Tax=Methylomarinum roseum TaxID=3067653 RepID=A0AAU7NR74_9GAMM|nr:DUF883 C-terminal domain-containing protein [Methylomarinum sp. Ch1-1]MDP4520537.1 DUF883 C-terminal domain-containing protein [Methylomarinum sp. Ch1-1]
MATQQASNEELQKQLEALREDFADLAKTIKTMSSAYVGEKQEGFQHAAEQAQQQVKDSFGKVEGEVKANPLTSLAISFGVGVLIGKLLDR